MLQRIASLLRVNPPVIADRGLLWASGSTVPTDGTDGYQASAFFQDTTNGILYVNEGSITSCEFNAVATGGLSDTLTVGSFASLLHGSGIPISSSQTGAALIYSDDNNANITSSVRGTLSRFLLTTDQSGGSIRAAMGQLKLATGVDVTTGIYTGLQGYLEMAGTHSAKTGSTFSCIDASMEIGTALTVDQYGEACGIHVETTGSGTITNNGTCAAVLIDKAAGAANWPYGVYVVGSTAHQAFVAGVQGTGVETTTTYPFAVEIHNEANADIVAGDTGSSAGIYNRYEIATAQTSQCNHISVFAKLRPKANLADGVHCGVYGLVEASGTTEIAGTSTTQTCAGHFALDFGENLTVSTGHLNGLVVDSSINSSADISGATVSAIRIKKSGSSAAWPTGVEIEDNASTTGISVGTCTTGVTVASATQAYKAEYNVSSSLGSWVHGVKVELTRTANIQPATGGWFGGQFVLNAGSSGYDSLNRGTYVLQAVFKGSDTTPNGTDIHVARFETQSAGKVSDICHILANTGTTVVGSLLYLATHIAPSNSMALFNVQSSQTVAKGLSFLAGSGSTLTSLLYCSGSGTFTNFFEVAASGDGGVTVGTTDIASDLTADAYLTIKVGSNSYKILAWSA